MWKERRLVCSREERESGERGTEGRGERREEREGSRGTKGRDIVAPPCSATLQRRNQKRRIRSPARPAVSIARPGPRRTRPALPFLFSFPFSLVSLPSHINKCPPAPSTSFPSLPPQHQLLSSSNTLAACKQHPCTTLPIRSSRHHHSSELSIPLRQFGSCSKTSCKQLFNWRFRGHHAVASDIRVRVRSGILQQFLAIKRQQHWLDRTPEAGLEIVLPEG